MEENAAPPAGPAPVLQTPPPPPPPPPPVIMPPPSSAAPRRNRGWMIFALILLVLLAISFISNLGHFASGLLNTKTRHARTGGPRLEEVVIEGNEPSGKIAVLEVQGIITG